jgi:hypothetical protein
MHSFMSCLTPARAAALRRERERLAAQLSGFSSIVHGSFLERFSTCSRRGCVCHRGRRHGPRAYVVVRAGKTQRQHYIPQGQIEAVRKAIAQYHRLMALADRISAITLQWLRGGQFDDADRRGPPRGS